MEIWRQIPGYEGLYSASDLGRIKSLRQNKVMATGKRICNSGYEVVNLWKHKAVRSFMVHRIIAQTFCEGRTDEKIEVNHKNLKKRDNRADNLEWVTPSQNMRHMMAKRPDWHSQRNLSSGENHYMSKVSNAGRKNMLALFDEGRSSIHQLVKIFKMSKSNVYMIIRKERKKNEKSNT